MIDSPSADLSVRLAQKTATTTAATHASHTRSSRPRAASTTTRAATSSSISLYAPTSLQLSRACFRVCWLVILVMHAVSINVNASTIAVVRFLQTGDVDEVLLFLGDETAYFLEYAVVASSILLAGHLVCLLQMLLFSTYHRELLFHSPVSIRSVCCRSRPRVQPTQLSSPTTLDIPSQQQRNASSSITQMWQTVSHQAATYFGRHGSFGIEGAHYDTFYGVVEAVSVVVRAFQAYRISMWIPRLWIARGYALLVMVSCFSIPLVKLLVANPPLQQRVALLAVDVTFDFVTAVVFPMAIAMPYVLEYDVVLLDFPLIDYYHDTWFVQAVSENKLAFATSWLDFGTKTYPKASCLFGVALIATCLAQKDETASRAPNVTSKRPSSIRSTRRRSSTVAPATTTTTMTRVGTSTAVSTTCLQRRSSAAEMLALFQTTWRQRSVSSAYWRRNGFFIAMGVALFVIQLYSLVVASRTSRSTCLLEMHPWFHATPQCAVLEVHCAHSIDSDGSAADIDAFVADLTPSAVQSLIFASCPRLQLPRAIARFHNLHVVKIYNCTIDSWDGDATLTAANHPNIQLVYIVDTNMTDVPLGLLADDFPPTLTDIEFSGTNLTRLPEEVAVKWAAVYYFVLERSVGTTVFPSVLTQLRISFLSLSGNSIASIPDDAFVNQTFWELYFAHNPLETLPADIGDMTKLSVLDIRLTRIADLPQWMMVDGVGGGSPTTVSEQTVRVDASGSLLCTSANMDASTSSAADVVVQSSNGHVSSSALFDVVCAARVDATTACLYPLEAERRWRAHA